MEREIGRRHLELVARFQIPKMLVRPLDKKPERHGLRDLGDAPIGGLRATILLPV